MKWSRVNPLLTRRDNVPLLFASVLMLGALGVRAWYFRHTVGMLYGGGSEEAFRLSCIYNSKFVLTTSPFQTHVGRFLLNFFPNAIYITRYISFFTGVFAAGLLMFCFDRKSIFLAFFAGVSLILCPAHITFSTVGTAESLSFFLLFLLLLSLNQAREKQLSNELASSKRWSFCGGLACAAATLTRFETWVVIPLLLIFVLVFFRRLLLWWLFAFLTPFYWMIKSRIQGGSFFASGEAEAGSGITRALADQYVLATLRSIYDQTGILVLALAALGAVWLLRRRSNWPLLIFGSAISIFIIIMMYQCKIVDERKYAYNIAVWLYIFFGVGIGALVQLVCPWLTLEDYPTNASSTAKLKRLLALGFAIVIGTLAIINITTPVLADYTEDRLMREGTPFNNYRDFSKVLPTTWQNASASYGYIYLMTSFPHIDFVKLYQTAEMKGRLKLPAWGENAKVSELVMDLAAAPPDVETHPVAMIVTEPYSPCAPKDDLSVEQTINGLHLMRVLVRKNFRFYRVEPAGI